MNQNFNLERFTNEVEQSADWIFFQLEQNNSKNLLPKSKDNEISKDLEDIQTLQELLDSSERTIKQNKIKSKICPALKSIRDDLQDINKVVIKILVPIAIVGAIPLNPLFFAGMSIVILKAGISTYCSNNGN